METTIQDYPGRIGYWAFAIPPSGHMDNFSFCIGNVLVGIDKRSIGLEIQFIGPEIEFMQDILFAVTGANNLPELNQCPIPCWKAILAKKGDRLSFGFAQTGARTYLSFAGAIDVPSVLGSKSTFINGKLGGLHGRALKQGDTIMTKCSNHDIEPFVGKTLCEQYMPSFSNRWNIEVTLGPHDDWLTAEDLNQLISIPWKVSSQSN